MGLTGLLPRADGHAALEQSDVQPGKEPAFSQRLVRSLARQPKNLKFVLPPEPNLMHLKPAIDFQLVQSSAAESNLQHQVGKLSFLADAPGFIRLGASLSQPHRRLAAGHDLDAALL